MFAKLLKHEMKATAPTMGLLSLAAIGIGAVGGFMMRYLVNRIENRNFDDVDGIFVLLYVFVFLALMAYALGSEIFLNYQFYKRKFTDEGYLTFTLPAHSWQIFLSSMVNIMIWSLVIGIVMFLAIGSIFAIGIVGTPLAEEFTIPDYAFEEIRDVFREFSPALISYSISQFISSIVVMMTCITLGSILAKRHKILAAIGVYYAWSLIIGMISTQLMGSILYVSSELDFTRVYTIETAIQIAVAMGGFLLSIWLMDRKLNLP